MALIRLVSAGALVVSGECIGECTSNRNARKALIGNVVVPGDVEEPVHTPVTAPGVLHDPVALAVQLIPSHDFNSMSTSYFCRGGFVDTSVLGHEVFLDSEAHLDGPIGHQLSLLGSHALQVSAQVGCGHHVAQSRAIAAGRGTLSVIDTFVETVSIVRLGEAGLVDHPRVLEELPSFFQLPTVTAMVLCVAQHHVHRGELHLAGTSLGGGVRRQDSRPVPQSSSRGKSPAATTVQLGAGRGDAVGLHLTSVPAVGSARCFGKVDGGVLAVHSQSKPPSKLVEILASELWLMFYGEGSVFVHQGLMLDIIKFCM